MERNIKISLEKAREWYNSGNNSLKEVALQAFKESELIKNPWETIKTFEDACRVLNINPDTVSVIYDTHLQNMYKLQIVRKALNADWKPKFNTGVIYYPWLRYYPKGSNYSSSWTSVANFKDKEDNNVYTLVSIGYFKHFGHGGVDAVHGLLSCKSEEIAKYFGITFGKLIFDVFYGHYNNYAWV